MKPAYPIAIQFSRPKNALVSLTLSHFIVSPRFSAFFRCIVPVIDHVEVGIKRRDACCEHARA